MFLLSIYLHNHFTDYRAYIAHSPLKCLTTCLSLILPTTLPNYKSTCLAVSLSSWFIPNLPVYLHVYLPAYLPTCLCMLIGCVYQTGMHIVLPLMDNLLLQFIYTFGIRKQILCFFLYHWMVHFDQWDFFKYFFNWKFTPYIAWNLLTFLYCSDVNIK